MKADLSERLIYDAIVTSLKEKTSLTLDEIEDAAFHMTDWLSELVKLVGVYENIQGHSVDEVYRALLDFLVHAPEHIVAAAEIVTGCSIDNIFKRE